jgi:hypothetical protein
MAQHSYKPSDFMEEKKFADIHIENQLSTYSIELPSAVKTASILDLKLVQARMSLARDPITSLIFRIRSSICCETLIQRRPQKIVKRVAVWGARRPDLLHSHLRKALLEPVLHPLAVLGRSAVLLEMKW